MRANHRPTSGPRERPASLPADGLAVPTSSAESPVAAGSHYGRSGPSPRTVRCVLASLVVTLVGTGALCAQEQSSAEERRVGRGRLLRLQHEAGPVHVVQVGDEPGRHAVFLGDTLGRGYLGVDLLALTEELREHFGVPRDRGVMISRVETSSPAEEAGLQVGDIITELDGVEVASVPQLSLRVRRRDEGEVVNLGVWRDGSLLSYELQVGERERHVLPVRIALPEIKALEIEEAVKLRSGEIEEAMEHVKEYFGGEEWEERVRRFESLDWKTIERRMRQVEERIRELEEQLEREEN